MTELTEIFINLFKKHFPYDLRRHWYAISVEKGSAYESGHGTLTAIDGINISLIFFLIDLEDINSISEALTKAQISTPSKYPSPAQGIFMTSGKICDIKNHPVRIREKYIEVTIQGLRYDEVLRYQKSLITARFDL